MPSRRRDVQVNLRLSEAEAVQIQAHADAANQTLSAYIRDRALDGSEVAALRARVEKLEEMAEQYDNLAALLANPQYRTLPG